MVIILLDCLENFFSVFGLIFISLNNMKYYEAHFCINNQKVLLLDQLDKYLLYLFDTKMRLTILKD